MAACDAAAEAELARLTSHRKTDFRRGRRLGVGDHVVEWPKPPKPRSIDREAYDALPESLPVRECRARVGHPGFRARSLILATTVLAPNEFTGDELAGLYRARWNAELDLRSLKQTIQTHVLRCKTPELVRKELWAHILAYNLIRVVMAQAATRHGAEPRTLSFKGAVPTLCSFRDYLNVRQPSSAGIPRRRASPPRSTPAVEPC
ncbi:transposase [bacterium]|nr:transposase [bacterium]